MNYLIGDKCLICNKPLKIKIEEMFTGKYLIQQFYDYEKKKEISKIFCGDCLQKLKA